MRPMIGDSWIALGLPLVLALAVTGTLYAQSGQTRRLEGGGEWKLDRPDPSGSARRGRLSRASGSRERWQARLTRRAGGSLTGRLSLTAGGAPVISDGKLRGKIAGSKVWGEVADEDGRQALTFEGTITPAGAQGRFTSRDDEVGTWSWEGQPPR
jgi:hypothetical protein